MTVRLFTSLYPERNPVRRSEIQECLRRNLACASIGQICLLLEGGVVPPRPDQRLLFRHVDHRPRYQEFFDWANELITNESDVTIVANSDIFFDSSLAALCSRLGPEPCAALARWDVQPDGSSRLFARNDSQDAWIFQGKIRPVVADFCIGIPRCDNRILHELRTAGYQIINPAFSIRACHLHAGNRAEYPAEIQGPHVDPPYEYLWPHNLCSLPATLLHRLRHPEAKLGWRFDWKKFQRTLPFRIFRKLKRLAAGD